MKLHGHVNERGDRARNFSDQYHPNYSLTSTKYTVFWPSAFRRTLNHHRTSNILGDITNRPEYCAPLEAMALYPFREERHGNENYFAAGHKTLVAIEI